MDFSEIFKDAFTYPTKNWSIFVVVASLVVFLNIFNLFDYFSLDPILTLIIIMVLLIM